MQITTIGKKKIKTAISEKVLTGFNYTAITLIVLICVYPFLNVLAYSFSSSRALVSGMVTFFPKEIQFESYKQIVSNPSIWKSMWVTIVVTLSSTALGLIITIGAAYGLSKKRLKGRRMLTLFIIFTMYFSGGIIPTFLVVKELKLLNTLGALILPSAVSAFNFIVMKSFFQQLPVDLEEAAILDGCNDFQVLVRIILPLSMPIIATIGLFYAVGHWNEYFSSMMYINDSSKYTLQLKLRQLLFTEELTQLSGNIDNSGQAARVMPESLKAASIIVSTIPIILVYPWLQRYFVKGVMLGSVKG